MATPRAPQSTSPLPDAAQREQVEDALAASRQRLSAELDCARRLQAVSTQLIQADDIESLYEKILDTATAIMRADFASYQMLCPERGERGELRLLAHRGFTPEAAGFWEWVRPDSQSTCGIALDEGNRCIVPDVLDSDLLAGSEDREVLLAMGIRAVQTTPLLSRTGALLGMISTHWREPHEPTESEFRALDVLARQAADLIERTRNEQALKESNRRKDEFLATLAHELRNPLAPLRNALQLLRLKREGEGAALELIEMMERQVDYIVRMVDDLLDVSRINRGTVELRKEHFALAAVLEEASEAIRPTCDSLGHELSIAFPVEPLYVCGDRIRLGQVMHNLLHNACKFTSRGGRIAFGATRDGDEAVISVRDTGAGIGPEQLLHVFDLFMQADTSLTRSGSGMGIGLTLVRDLVALHGGTVVAASEGPGRGSEFTVRLPLVPEPKAPRRQPAPGRNRESAAPRRILVVDDNRDSADSLAEVLRMRGHEVHTAYDGLDAVAAAAQLEPDLILLDIGLPRLDGYQAARRIREQRPHGGYTMVALTGWGQDADRRQSADAGFDRHVVKPIDRDVLEELLPRQ